MAQSWIGEKNGQINVTVDLLASSIETNHLITSELWHATHEVFKNGHDRPCWYMDREPSFKFSKIDMPQPMTPLKWCTYSNYYDQWDSLLKWSTIIQELIKKLVIQ